MGDDILFIQNIGGENYLSALNLDNMSLEWTLNIKDYSRGYLIANDKRWVVGHIDADYLSLKNIHKFMFGSPSGDVEGTHHGTEFILDNQLEVHPVGDGLLYWSDGRIWFARPGAGPLPEDIEWATVGGLLIAAGMTWPVAAPKVLHRLSAGGKRRCLNCGFKRPAGIGFCSKCGWRTKGEDAAANRKRDAWEHEW